MQSILDTGKDGYSSDDELDRRTRAALQGKPSEWGAPEDLFRRDAVEVLDFIRGDYQVVAPILAGIGRYRILDLGFGYGRLAPFLSAFACCGYAGIERQVRRVTYAQARYGCGAAKLLLSFFHGDIFGFADGDVGRCHRRQSDVVWTSNVLQHLTMPDKRRLVETMKKCRARGGICLLREEMVIDQTHGWCQERYAHPDHPKHMIPTPLSCLAEWFEPLHVRPLGGNMYQASEE